MSKTFYIQIGNKKVPVSEEIYRAFKRPVWVERKRRKVRADHERSLERFFADGYDIPAAEPLVEDIVVDKLSRDMLMAALDELTDDERNLIDALFFEGKSERTVASELGLSQKGVNKRRHRIIEKLRDLMDL